MSQPPIGPFARRAERLFERGVAAAIGGQRIVAAGLLRQVVRLDPTHEQAWLWLSGVLDSRKDVEFCLRAVLQLNPDNERARTGLSEIDHWRPPEDATGPSTRDYLRELSPATLTGSTGASVPWWMNWRNVRLAMRSLIVILWLIPLLLLGTTGAVRAMLAAQPLPRLVTYRDLETPTGAPDALVVPSATAPVATTLAPTPSAVVEEPAAAGQSPPLEEYLARVAQERERLRQAVTDYRIAIGQGSTNLERAAAANILKQDVERGHSLLAAMEIPAEAVGAHQSYLEGLVLETQALQELQAFYETDDSSAANRAVVRLQDARARIADATARWEMETNPLAP